MASGLLDKANIILTPTGYKAGTMYNVAPIEQPYEDFVFSRASVASRVNSSGLVEMVGRTLGSNLVQNGDFSDIGPDLVQNGTFDLGSELVTNGDFTDGLNNWFVNANATGYVSTSSDTLQYLVGHGDYAEVKQLNNSVVGKTYTGQFEVISKGTNADVFIQYGRTFIYTGSINSLDLGVHTFTVVSSHPDGFSISVRTNGIVEIDNVSVKEVPDWSLTQATVSNNTLQLSTTDGSYTAATQSLGSIGESYKIQLDVSNIVGTISVAIGGGTDVDITTNGTHTIYIKSASTTFELKRKFGITNVSASITNVVVQELDPNDYWTLQNGWSLGDDEAVFSGTVSAYRKLYQTNFITIGKTYQLSFEITSITAGSIANLEPGSPSFDTVGVKTQTFVATFDDLYLEPTTNANLTITNISVQEVIDTNNIPRINYDSNGENGHWLLEPTSTNLVTYSEDFTQWGKTDATVESGYLAPDGSNSAYKVLGTVGSSSIYLGGVNATDTRTIWARTVSGTGTVNLCSYGGNTNNNFTITEEWQRFEVNGTTTSTGGTNFYAVDFRFNVANPLSELIIWGAQAEALPYATSYIPSLTGSTETRATETATGAGSADLINSTEGVLYAEIAALADDLSTRYIAITDGTSANVVYIRYDNVSNRIIGTVTVGGSSPASFVTTSYTITNLNKIALKWKTNDFSLWINGTEVGSDSSGASFSANTLNELSFARNNTLNFYGKCKALAVFNTALTDAELTELTS